MDSQECRRKRPTNTATTRYLCAQTKVGNTAGASKVFPLWSGWRLKKKNAGVVKYSLVGTYHGKKSCGGGEVLLGGWDFLEVESV